MKDLLLDDNDDVLIANGDFVIGASDMQDVSIILQMHPGELKQDPILGVGLSRKVKRSGNAEDLEVDVKLHLKRDNKDYSSIKNKIKFNLNTL